MKLPGLLRDSPVYFPPPFRYNGNTYGVPAAADGLQGWTINF